MNFESTELSGPEVDWSELIRELSNPVTSNIAASACRRYILGALVAKHSSAGICSLANRMDTSDIANSIMGSFLRVSSNYVDKQGDEVRKILLTIIRNKTADKLRENFADKRNVRKESIVEDYVLETGKSPAGQGSPQRPLDGDAQLCESDKHLPVVNARDFQALVDQLLTPESFELFADFQSKVPKQLHEVLLMIVHGFTTDEISEQLHCSTRTVKRKLALVRDYLADWRS